jgi:hypothetical protein
MLQHSPWPAKQAQDAPAGKNYSTYAACRGVSIPYHQRTTPILDPWEARLPRWRKYTAVIGLAEGRKTADQPQRIPLADVAATIWTAEMPARCAAENKEPQRSFARAHYWPQLKTLAGS